MVKPSNILVFSHPSDGYAQQIDCNGPQRIMTWERAWSSLRPPDQDALWFHEIRLLEMALVRCHCCFSRSPWGHLNLGYSKIWLATSRITVESYIDISEKLGQCFVHNFNSNIIYACNLTQEETILLLLCQGAKGYCNMKGKFPGCKGILVSRATLWKHDHHNSDFATSWTWFPLVMQHSYGQSPICTKVAH